MKDSLEERIRNELEPIIQDLATIQDDEYQQERLFQQIGWRLSKIQGIDQEQLNTRFNLIFNQYTDYQGSIDGYELLTLFYAIIREVRSIDEVLNHEADGLTQEIIDQFSLAGQQLINQQILFYLRGSHPFWTALFELFGIIPTIPELDFEPPLVDAQGNVIRHQYLAQAVQIDQLVNAVLNPIDPLNALYFDSDFFNDPDLAKQTTKKLIERLQSLLSSLQLRTFPIDEEPDPKPAGHVFAGEVGLNSFDFFIDPLVEGSGIGFDITFFQSLQGEPSILIEPYGNLQFTDQFLDWEVEFNLNVREGGGVLINTQGVTVRSPSGNVNPSSIMISSYHPLDKPLILIGDLSGSYLEIHRLTFEVQYDPQTGFHYGWGAEGIQLVVDGIGILSIEQFTSNFGKGITFDIDHFRFDLDLFEGFKLDLDLKLKWLNGHISGSDSKIKLYKPSVSNLLPLHQFHLDSKCLAVRWDEPEINRWLEGIASDFFDATDGATNLVTARVLFGSPFDEVRLDWAFSGQPRTFQLPGFIRLITPSDGQLSLLLGAAGRSLSHVSLGIGLQEGQTIQIQSDFSWLRDGDRELQNDATDSNTDPPPFFTVLLTPKRDMSLILIDFDLADPGLPDFFKVPEPTLTILNFEDTETICTPISGLNGIEQHLDDWTVCLNLDTSALQFPFLKTDQENADQFVEIYFRDEWRPPRPDPDPHPGSNLTYFPLNDGLKFDIPLGIKVNLSSDFQLYTFIDLEFDLLNLSLDVKHEDGIDLNIAKPTVEGNLLGMEWTFHASPDKKTLNGREAYPLFKLVTKGNNYGIKLAEGAYLDLAFKSISDEPLIFRTTDFAIMPNGINLTTTVVDSPIRLNGIDTKFRFDGTGVTIVNSEIESFTLAGTGPLPPALIGEATVDINLQFGPTQNNTLTLKSGSARLKRKKPLICPGTRFQFQIHAIGLKFVNDGRFHLYFTLTGIARFVLADVDDADGPLGLLPTIQLEMIECPLTGDASVIGKHVRFLIEMPKPISFPFLGAFEMELRAIGFVPQFDPFDGDGAMQITGQVKFAQGSGDVPNGKPDYHKLFIGLPGEGETFPRIYFTELPININMGEAFRLNGVVGYINEENPKYEEEGFFGQGTISIQGLPTIAGAFTFSRVRRNERAPWVRAWFLYLELREVSFMIPVVQLYIREIGFGLGYRYTLVSIKAADETKDAKQLIHKLSELSRTQANLADRAQWAVDIEEAGKEPRWTIVFRALISQNSASASPLSYDPIAERDLPSLFLFDAMISFRSDFTFYMAARGWINTNYNDILIQPKLRERPFVSGFILLSPRQKRLIAHVASNPDGEIGDHPKLPKLVKRALEAATFSATLLLEPGLLHFELGWPNNLRWEIEIGPFAIQNRGGVIFRISTREFVVGINFTAKGSLNINVGFDAGFVGLAISAYASVAYGSRYIGVIDFDDPGSSAYYGAQSMEINVRISVRFWVDLALVTIKFRLSVAIHFSASVEVGIALPELIGVRATGTIALRVMGKRVGFSVSLAFDPGGLVDKAKAKTKETLKLGIFADDSATDDLPGLGDNQSDITLESSPVRVGTLSGSDASPLFLRSALLEESVLSLATPHYTLFAIRDGSTCFFVLMPQGDLEEDSNEGFLPPPPNENTTVISDFELIFPESFNPNILEQFVPELGRFEFIHKLESFSENKYHWKANWSHNVIDGVTHHGRLDGTQIMEENASFTLADFLSYAFRKDGGFYRDPAPIFGMEQRLTDERMINPTDDAFEAAVIGAVEQFRGSPHFKLDPDFEYDRLLEAAYHPSNNVYHQNGTTSTEEEKLEARRNMEAHQVRGMIIHEFIADIRDYLSLPEEERAAFADQSIPFQLGLVFQLEYNHEQPLPDWVERNMGQEEPIPHIRQRSGATQSKADSILTDIRTFNVRGTGFDLNPPQFERVAHYTNSHTVAIRWDLTWSAPPSTSLTSTQSDPEQHLLHYEIRRRDLDRSAPEKRFSVKPADVLQVENRGGESTLYSLKPKFQFIDHFTEEQEEEQINLPAEGRRFLYSITPIDYTGKAGRPLTLVATRYPDSPPLVPSDAELTVIYRLFGQDAQPPIDFTIRSPEVVQPHMIQVGWTEPQNRSGQPTVSVGEYRLIFRKEETLPVGHYGLDGATSGKWGKGLPSSNARVLPTDIKINLDPKGLPSERTAEIETEALKTLGILPDDGQPFWRPEAWHVYIQTTSINGVPSALAPVGLILRIENETVQFPIDPNAQKIQREERRPAELEWLPYPIRLAPIPATDMNSTTGIAYFPMINTDGYEDDPDTFRFGGTLNQVNYRSHPLGIRSVRFRWNQGPSGQPEYPLDLNAEFQILELNVDKQTTHSLNPGSTDANSDPFFEALRPIQDVQLIPADELWLAPNDTLAVDQWEAWYPSSLQRRQDLAADPLPAPSIPLSPWYSWRESFLQWPIWPKREALFGENLDKPLFPHHHPLIGEILQELIVNEKGQEVFSIGVQPIPPYQPMTLDTYLDATATDADPYGWGILQKLRLSTSFTLRNLATGELLTGEQLLRQLNRAIGKVKSDLISNTDLIHEHLHIEFLFQPSRSIDLNPIPVESNALLGVVQLSLRPIPIQYLYYSTLTIFGPPNLSIEVEFPSVQTSTTGTTAAEQPFVSVINHLQPAEGEIQIGPDNNSLPIKLSPNGEAILLFRNDVKELPFQLNIYLPTTVLYENLPAAFKTVTTFDPTDGKLTLHKSLSEIAWAVNDINTIRDILMPNESLLELGFNEKLAPFRPYQFDPPYSSYFEVPDTLIDQLLDSNHAAHKQWLRLKILLEQMNLPVDVEGDRIKLPTDKEGIEEILFDTLVWSQRFFTHSPAHIQEKDTPSDHDLHGWIVTAYPKVTSPTYATPDEAGRLTYYHLLEDKWAHTFRYYIQPSGRYDRMWASLREILTPSPLGSIVPYTVKSGDTLISIANRFFGNGDYRPILAENDREVGDILFPGDRLRIPLVHCLYIVEPNDSQWRISDKFYGNGNQWGPIGRINAERLRQGLHPGIELIIPKPDGVGEPTIIDIKRPPILDLPRDGSFEGGLDVIFERIGPLEMPVILASSRLDVNLGPGAPSVPGSRWEVIIAQHPEQAISEQNQTVARHLSYRQIATTLLRRFAYGDWLNTLDIVDQGNFSANPVYPALPERVPKQPDHLILSDPDLSEDDRLAVGLPNRLNRFQEGAIVIQWDALPFYYEHRLLTLAHADKIHSPINEVIQQHFEYQSPEPAGYLKQNGATRLFEIPLKRFWDSLPPNAQAQWPSENPDEPDPDGHLKYGGFPDPDVVYQIIDFHRGNIEVQAEIFFDDKQKIFRVRQLGKIFIAQLSQGIPIRTEHRYHLEGSIEQQITFPLQTAIDPYQSTERIRFQENTMTVTGVYTIHEHTFLLGAPGAREQGILTDQADRAMMQRYFDSLWCEASLSQVPPNLPDPLPSGLIDAIKIGEHCALVWEGKLDTVQEDALRALNGDRLFRQAIQRLIGLIRREPAVDVQELSLARGPEQWTGPEPQGWQFINRDGESQPNVWQYGPGDGRLMLVENEAGDMYQTLRWEGPLTEGMISDIEPTWRAWAQIPELDEALSSLISQFRSFERDVQIAVPSADLLNKLSLFQHPDPQQQVFFEEQFSLLRPYLHEEGNQLIWRGWAGGAADFETFGDFVRQLLEIPIEERLNIDVDSLKRLGDSLLSVNLEVPIEIGIRPTQASIEPLLAQQLLIGRAKVRIRDPLSHTQAELLAKQFESLPDRNGIGRLYHCQLLNGLEDHQLIIRSRRDNASPSIKIPFVHLPLDLDPSPVTPEERGEHE
ncbi:MAG: hypothetical protein CL609_10800 [Anaerolineaceae bacterium]|nr:hypothetical protein [Anaerolineaceae bacterium]